MSDYDGLGVTSQIFFCGLPLRFDSYKGCDHGCLYCFASTAGGAARKVHGASRRPRPEPADLAALERHLSAAASGDVGRCLAREMLRHGVPVHWGGMSDPFQSCEAEHRVSFDALRIFARHETPVVISTKGTIVADDGYLQRTVDARAAVQISITTVCDRIGAGLEPGAPLPSARLRAIEALSSAGLFVAARLQPMIIDSEIEAHAAETVRAAVACGARHVIVEAYKPGVDDRSRVAAISGVLGTDVAASYGAYCSSKNSRDVHLPTWRKAAYLRRLSAVCHEEGVTMGAADNDLRMLGDSPCCCGVDALPGFENWWRMQSSWVADMARRTGSVTLDDASRLWRPTANFNSNKCLWRRKGNDLTPWGYFQWAWGGRHRNGPAGVAHLEARSVPSGVVYDWVDHPPCMERGPLQEDMFAGRLP